MAALSGIHHVGIVVESIEASAAWYVENLGFELLYSFEFPGVRAAFIGRGALRLELFQNELATRMEDGRRNAQSNLRIGGINHVAIQVDDLADVVTSLREKGVGIASPPRDVPNGGGDRFAFIQDNEGMLIELFQPA